VPRKTTSQASGLVTTTGKAPTRAKQGQRGVNVGLPTDLHMRLRLRAIKDGMTLQEAVTAAVKQYVAQG